MSGTNLNRMNKQDCFNFGMEILYSTAEWRAGVSSPDRLEGVASERKRSQSVSGLEGGEEVQRKRALSGQERQKKWTTNNDKKVQIKNMKRHLGVPIAKKKILNKKFCECCSRIRKYDFLSVRHQSISNYSPP